MVNIEAVSSYNARTGGLGIRFAPFLVLFLIVEGVDPQIRQRKRRLFERLIVKLSNRSRLRTMWTRLTSRRLRQPFERIRISLLLRKP